MNLNLMRALLAAHPIGTRLLRNGTTQRESQLEASALQPVANALSGLYDVGLSVIGNAPNNATEGELVEFLYAAMITSAASNQLFVILFDYLVDGFELGIELGLEEMGVTGEGVDLTNQSLIDQIDSYANQLRNDLVMTTARDLAAEYIRLQDENGVGILDVIVAALIAFILGRALYRAFLIVGNELIWASRFGLLEVYRRNDVLFVMFLTQRDERVDDICWQFDGQIFPIDNIPQEARIPLHLGCRCSWLPDDADWQEPTVLWFGV